ncbi:MAG: lysostaphin resistance A-like protein [Actinomycetota bacterium]
MPGFRWARLAPDRRDLLAIAALYTVVVALAKLALGIFTTDSTLGLFLCFGAGLVVGVVGPVVYTVWGRGRPLSSLGIGLHRWRSTVALAVLFGAVQFSITLWGYDLPLAVDWVPLLVMSVVVGLFEAVFFRGFVQGTLERSFGAGPAVLGAAALYAVYHVGYGMGSWEMVFLLGLGVVYGVAYRITENVLVLWPLLTPAGAFFNNLQAGDLAGQLPWASIAGFADVLGLMAVAIWLGHRREQRLGAERGMGAAALRRAG